jgi:hypothetical protein
MTYFGFVDWKVSTKMKMLSTPMARTRKGMTSEMIRVAGNPIKLHNPTEMRRDINTIQIPPRPNTNFE